MSKITITQWPDPSGYSSDPFTEVLRDGARKRIEQAIHAKLATLMSAFSRGKLKDGRTGSISSREWPRKNNAFWWSLGADEYGRKELLAMTEGFRESTQSWSEVLLDLKRRGLTQDPRLAIGDDALGIWPALREICATTREQRCWSERRPGIGPGDQISLERAEPRTTRP